MTRFWVCKPFQTALLLYQFMDFLYDKYCLSFVFFGFFGLDADIQAGDMER